MGFIALCGATLNTAPIFGPGAVEGPRHRLGRSIRGSLARDRLDGVVTWYVPPPGWG